MTGTSKIHQLKKILLELHDQKASTFTPGETPVSTGEAIFDHLEITAVLESLLEGWLGLAKKGEEFESLIADFTEKNHSLFVNSGSSANLLALSAIKEKRKISEGEVITTASAFPTTVNPILQTGFSPVLVDIDDSLNISPELVEQAVSPKTRGIIFAHALGNPARIDALMEIAKKHDLFIIEDCCSALGSMYDGRPCGSYGTASTLSFYAAHGITTGEGGAISTDDPEVARLARSMRDWGRDCYCSPDQLEHGGACGRRFDYNLEGTPYDHRYIYSTVGYNLKPLELQAAIGIAQMKRLVAFNNKRRENFTALKETFLPLKEFFLLPGVHEKSDPVFFGFPLLVNHNKIDRAELAVYLNKRKIATRYFFSGNLTRQPAYRHIDFRVPGELHRSDEVMKRCLWIGLHPGITEEMIKYIKETFTAYLIKKGLINK